MKKGLSLLVSVIVLLSVLGGCAGADRTGAARVNDGRARPSSCGRLQVKDGKLCSERGEPVMLRGVSTHDLITVESFVNDDLFRELSEDYGVNVVRLAVYTYGVGVVGYCTKGDRERYQKNVANGVAFAKAHDMYAIIDWHVLSEGDPNIYLEDAKAFFAETAEQYRDHNHVLYEICNEPNGVDWQTVKRYAEEIIPIIREKDPDSVILVGNPDWSKDLESVAADPLSYDNVMYTLHFYSATHGQEFRDMLERVGRDGLPVFVTEFGVTASSGGLPRDLESADQWIDLLERYNVSYCMWALSKANEACSMIRFTVPKYSGFAHDDFTETGLWLLETLKKH
ncbi:MAG: glycoside hydrolase family 5 protein [Clostridia bacterium]|nr:glycoside hydrolase family 5 protein [Clostridia bacterium]